jgi:hypothetical protein
VVLFVAVSAAEAAGSNAVTLLVLVAAINKRDDG